MALDPGGGGETFVSRVGRFFRRSDDGGRPAFNPGGGDTESQDDERKPIGVPEDYRAAVTRPYTDFGMSQHPSAGARATAGRTATYDRAPQYFDGDEWKPANLRPDSVAGIQRALVSAGLLSGNFAYGVWDSKTAEAYREVLTHANAKGISDRMALSELSTLGQINVGGGGEGGEGGGGGGRNIIGFDDQGNPIYEQFVKPPLELKTTNKDDLRRVYRKAIIDTLGEGWSQAQINELVDNYVGMEVRLQREAYGREVQRMEAEFYGQPDPYAGQEIPDSSSINIPSPETFLETEARKKDPVGYQAGELVNEFVPQFMQMMQGWV